jgi:uncharacterized damage-inducible protein DinB
MRPIPKPSEGEYAPYAIMYIGLLPDDGLVLNHLQDNLQRVKDVVYALPAEKLTSRFAENEWTVKEILVHIVDDERIYAYRALRFARGDKTELPGFEQDDYVPFSNANERTLANIFEEYEAVRMATITLFKNLDDAALQRSGIANGNIMSVRAAAYHIAGHELHHLNSILEIYTNG